MGRYYTSEMLRDPKLQEKTIDYALDKLNPAIQNVGSQALNQLSTKIRPNKKYTTNRKDLDEGALDIQKQLAKLGELHLRTPKGKKYNYCGPGTKLEDRLNSNDPKCRDPINKLDAVCQQPDIAYNEAGDNLAKKHAADKIMEDSIKEIPFGQRPWFATPTMYAIKRKRKLGLGVPKNGKSRRVKKTGKNN